VATALRTRNALLRTLLVLPVATACLALFGATASADEGAIPPRAVPAARSMPRSFNSYDDLITFASSVAADQAALDQRAIDTRARLDASISLLVARQTSGVRGTLFAPDADRLSRVDQAALTVQVVTLIRDQQQLQEAGALTAPRTAWRIPTVGEITQPFGPTDLWAEPARTYNGVAHRHFHDGVDIAGTWMADVVAPARGRVVYVGLMADGAEVVVLAHDAGVVTLYAHLDAWQSAPPVKAGDEVAAGQKIGTVGLTGITTGMHLHWAAYRAGQVIDPMSLVGK
jgi:murein DD-endopeptidase MepM/ murein hydrolase activator NlpD